MALRIAILGRPNVGKSTLFNRLTASRRALVHDTPGVTRDRLDGQGRIGDLRFEIIDTAGLEVGLNGVLSDRLLEQSLEGLSKADIGLFLIDARTGITPLDTDIAELLRRQSKPVIVIANKCEGRLAEALASEAWSLGLDEPVAISAEHGEGMADLAERIRSLTPEDRTEDPAAAVEDDPGTLRLAIVGRPNAGKSSLINRLVREERLLTGPEPGLTRDSVDVMWRWRNRNIQLVDTAGLRRKARINEKLEQLSASATARAIKNAEVVLLLMDGTHPLEKQELTIANLVLDQGRALVVAANKWDLVEDAVETLDEIRHRMRHRLGQVSKLPIVTISVLTGRGLDRLMPTIIETHDRWATRIPTGQLNRWLASAIETNPPPMAQNRRIKIRYATQVSSRPPTIALFANKPADALPPSYLRFLQANFRETFGLDGIDVRLRIRHGDNPYHE